MKNNIEFDDIDITPEELLNPTLNKSYNNWLELIKEYWFKKVGGAQGSRIGTVHINFNEENETVEIVFRPRFMIPELKKLVNSCGCGPKEECSKCSK